MNVARFISTAVTALLLCLAVAVFGSTAQLSTNDGARDAIFLLRRQDATFSSSGTTTPDAAAATVTLPSSSSSSLSSSTGSRRRSSSSSRAGHARNGGGEQAETQATTADSQSTSTTTDTSTSTSTGNRFLLAWRRGRSISTNLARAVLQLRGGGQDFVWPRLDPLSPRLWLALLLGAVGACLSSAGGVGGGGLYVPLFNLLVGFDSKTAAALSNFMILGGSFSNLGINMQQQHPEVGADPLIDYDAAMLLQPNVLLGISLGVICNVMFPAWSITALLAVTLFYMTTRSLSGAIRRWGHESRRIAEAAQAQTRAAQEDAEAEADGKGKLQQQHYYNGNGGDLRTPLLPAPHHGHRQDNNDDGGEEAAAAAAAAEHAQHAQHHHTGHYEHKLAPPDAKSTALFLTIPDTTDADDEAAEDVENQQAATPGGRRGAPGTPSGGTPSGRRPKLTRALTFEKVMKTISSENATVDEHGLHSHAITPGCVAAPLHRQYPLNKLGVLALVWLVFFAVQVLRGDQGQKLLHFRNCGWVYWLFTASQIPIALAFTFLAAHNTHSTHGNSDSEGGSPHHDDHVTFTQKAGGLLPVMAFLAGLLGGMLGIGGGMIINPLLLEIGMLPQVTAATCAFMVFFSSSMSVVQYWLLGRIPFDHGILFASICFVFSFVGQIVVQRIIVRYGRASVIVFSVSAVIGLSAVATTVFGGYEIVEKYLAGEYMGFHKPC